MMFNFSIKKKLALAAGAVSLLLFGSGTVLAESLLQNGQDAPAKQDAAAVAAANPDCHLFSATNSAGQRRVSTNNTPGFYTATSWTDLKCGTFNVTVPAGKSALVVVKTDAEVTCTTASAADSQWCQGRVLINGAEGQPTAPEPDSFSWSNSQTDSSAWESNAFSRTAYLRCPSGAVGAVLASKVCTFPIKVQVKNHAAGLNFRVDDATVDASLTYF
jgi:hypothetical protein